MNYSEFTRIISRLSLDCFGARLDHVMDAPNRLCLSFTRYVALDSTFAPRHLMFDFAPAHLDLYPVQKPPKAPQNPQAFTMLLRKYLVSQRVASLRLACDDRIVTLEFGPQDAPRHALIFEFSGQHSNVFLLDLSSDEILGSIHADEERCVHSVYQKPKHYPQNILNLKDRFEQISNDAYFLALESFFSERDKTERFQQSSTLLEKQIRQALKKYQNRLAALERDFEQTDLCQKARSEADLLSAYAFKIPEGSLMVVLPDFQTGEDVTIELTPGQSVRQNIEQRYNRCKRAARALPQIEARMDEASQNVDLLQSSLTKLAAAESFEQVDKLALECADILKEVQPKQQNPSQKKSVQEHKPYKTFTTNQGINILVGKSAEDNDLLTFKVARGNDWWLHVAHMPGSHVVVKSASPDSDSLLDAAMLAVHYSKLAQSSHAEVHATQQKNVRRIKGAPAGKVEIRGERIINVDIDEQRLKRLLKTET